MSLLAPEDLGTYLRVNVGQTVGLQAAIDAAEAAVASFIGLSTLAEEEIAVTLEAKANSSFLDLRRGPLVTIDTMTRDGEAVDLATYETAPWHIMAIRGVDAFFENEAVDLEYTVGWADADALAPDVKQAILMTAATIFNRPDAGAQNIGIQGVTFYRPDYLSPTVKDMLRGWQRRRL